MPRVRLRLRHEPSTDPLLGSRLHIAVLSAAAAGLAWVLGNAIPSPIGDYAYYAPLGAVLAINPTLANSIRRSVQLFGALLLGAALGFGFEFVPLPGPLGVATIVFVAVLASAWDVLGAERSWVMTGALFTYVLGRVDPTDFVVGMVAQVSTGALIGVALTMVLPPMPLTLAQRRLATTSAEVADQLDSAGAALCAEAGENEQDETIAREIIPDLQRLRTTIDALDESTIGNLRARHYQRKVERYRVQADTVVRVGAVVENVVFTLAEVQSSSQPWLERGSDLSRSIAEVLQRLATVVRAVGADEDIDKDDRQDLESRVDELERTIRQYRDDSTWIPGAALVLSLRRCLGVIEPEPTTTVVPPLTSPGHREARRRPFKRR
ncbi:FUSC family protein [Aeromicrobium phragmitis]|nr:FUSC family protein [Aeromicrobium phragmitis]